MRETEEKLAKLKAQYHRKPTLHNLLGSLLHQLPYIEKYCVQKDFFTVWKIIIAGCLRVIAHTGKSVEDAEPLGKEDLIYLKKVEAEIKVQMEDVNVGACTEVTLPNSVSTPKRGKATQKTTRKSIPKIDLDTFLAKTQRELMDKFTPPPHLQHQTFRHFKGRYEASTKLVRTLLDRKYMTYNNIILRCLIHPECENQ